MGLFTLLAMAIGLSMDAFAVSICKGLAMPKITVKNSMIVGAWFGGFQALMPFLGFVLGAYFAEYVNQFAPWIAFGLLGLIGANMIREACSKEEEVETATLKMGEMLLLAVATSIDALAVGVTFAFIPVKLVTYNQMGNTILACILIGITTWWISIIGVRIGNIFGTRYKNRAELAGGVILILLGIRILISM